MSSESSSRKRTLPIRRLVAEYYRQCGPARKLIPLQLFLTFIDAILQASVPPLTGYVVDQLRLDPQGFVHNKLPWLIPSLLGAALLFYAVAYTQHILANQIGNGAGVAFQVALYNHLQRLGADFYQRTHVGEVTSRLTNDINQGVMPLYMQFLGTYWALCMVLITCTWMLIISPMLLLVLLVVMTIMVFLTRSMRTRIHALNREVRDEAGRINARITEDISANALIRAFARENAFSEDIRKHSSVYLTKVLHTAKITTLFSDIMNTFMSILAPGALLLVGGAFAVAGGISVGALVTTLQFWLRASGPISMILNNLNMLYAALASMDRIFEFFRETPLVEDSPDATALRVTAGEIAVRDVTFHYPSDDHNVLTDLTFTVPARRSLALVGESGAGKSTITQLLLRFYDPQGGAICLDGQDIRTVTQESLRSQIGFVAQETILLSGTIRDNMRFAKPDATNKEIIQALKNAEAWEFVRELPQGLDTMLGERGARLSGGQKQRLSIARVFLKDPRIVIFDEATSALDTITEKQIQQTMQKLFKDRTAVIIAHRLSTIVDCDEIILLDGGAIVARGPHAHLLETCPRYYALCEKQMVVS